MAVHGIEIEEELVYKATNKGIPLNATFELTPLCNMSCMMCYARMTPEQLKAQGGIRSGEEWLKIAEEAAQAGTLFVLLTGGEPLLHPQFREIYLGLLRLGMIVSVNTNGTLLDESWINFFRKNPPRRMNITLYGASEETYQRVCGYGAGYKKTLRGIRLLLEQNISVKINSTIIRENEHEYEKMKSYAESLGVYFKADSYIFPCARGNRSSEILKHRLSPIKQGYCQFREKQGSENYFNYVVHAPIAKTLMQKQKENEPEENAWIEPECRAGKSSYWVNYRHQMLPCIFLEEAVFELSEGFEKAWEGCKTWINQLQLYAGCGACGGKRFCNVCAAALYAECRNWKKKPKYICECTDSYLNYLIAEEGKIRKEQTNI